MGGICKLVIKAYSDSSFGTEKGSLHPLLIRQIYVFQVM